MLRKLSLHGFKSFCDRTEITLGSGITSIVGPNGCGKSNLADALRWVLGEQNPRVLRSAKSQDVIFAGTQTKKAMGMAEVRLLFDSIGGDSEVEIARRIARDGSGEYRLNGKVCRWKDIIETLAGTGLSHTGYVVIGQGTIHELASGKPEDRRAWMDVRAFCKIGAAARGQGDGEDISGTGKEEAGLGPVHVALPVRRGNEEGRDPNSTAREV